MIIIIPLLEWPLVLLVANIESFGSAVGNPRVDSDRLIEMYLQGVKVVSNQYLINIVV